MSLTFVRFDFSFVPFYFSVMAAVEWEVPVESLHVGCWYGWLWRRGRVIP